MNNTKLITGILIVALIGILGYVFQPSSGKEKFQGVVTNKDSVRTQCEVLTNILYGTTQTVICLRIRDTQYLIPVVVEIKDARGKVKLDSLGKPVTGLQYLIAKRWMILKDYNRNFDQYLNQ